MKNFTRTDLLFSLCGLHCGLCPMQIDGYCPGCGGGAGNQSCSIARCSMQQRSIEYCYLCPQYPCAHYASAGLYDSFIAHQNQLADMRKAQEFGAEKMQDEIQQKVTILHTLLEHYNDGRRKNFYCVAVNLLCLEDVKTVMAQIAEKENKTQANKDTASWAVGLFQQMAQQRGIVLKLNKKKK